MIRWSLGAARGRGPGDRIAEPSQWDTLALLSLFVEGTDRRQGLGRHPLSHF
ncbi:MAG: hypothetical protein R2708_07445 [Vicinamibacterales bacterium]